MNKLSFKLNIIKKGTHILPVSRWNDDAPSPASMVAECLDDLEYRIKELVRVGGYAKDGSNNEQLDAFRAVKYGAENLNQALNEATKQGWKLEIG